MPRIVSTLLLALSIAITVKAQRILETVLDPANPQHQNALLGSNLYIAGHADTFLLRYDDETFTRLNYPIVSGLRLKFDSYANPLTSFNSALYFTLTPSPGGTGSRYLYRYTGSTFTRLAISGNIISNTIVYGSYLYFICDVSGTKRLYRYSGTSITEVTGAAIPISAGYKLFSTMGYLYITGYAGGTIPTNFIKRYDGTSFLTLPWTGPGTNPDEVIGVTGTTRVYFVGHERILYYNSSTVSQVFYNTGESITPKMWLNTLYFTTGVGSAPDRVNLLYRLSGATLSLVTLPAGYQLANVPHTNAEVYMGSLYFTAKQTATGITRVLRYDGTSFTSFMNITDPYISSGVRLSLRDGNLMIQPNFVNGTHAWEYNGSVFTEIIAPPGRLLFPLINGTACNYLWLNYYSDASGIHWAYAKEDRGCPPEPVTVIPEHFMIHERFDITTYGKDRGWCWSEIIVDWVVDPICPLPPPCPIADYNVRMIDANNGVAWSENFNTPKSFQVPLTDQQAFKTVLSSKETGKDLLVFETDLLPMGVESVTVNFKPKQNYFLLTTTTRNNAQVPFRATLLNASGKVIWEQTFTAPFSQQITATVQEPGKLLIFSIPGTGNKELITQAAPCPGDVLR